MVATARTQIDRWHAYADSHDASLLDAMLADDAVFISPVVHTPQQGKHLTRAYLLAAFEVLGRSQFQYRREFFSDTGAVLEFTAVIDGIQINGIDMIEWNSAGKISEFKVMVRPLKAVNLLHQKMGEMLQKMKNGA
jgi:SnoaL-like domain